MHSESRPAMTALLRLRSFPILWLAIFASTVGNFLLMLSLSVHMYQVTGMNFAAAAVFATQWLAALLSAPLGGWLTARARPARLSAGCELGGALASLAIGLAIGTPALVFGLLFVRGLFESIGKSARVVALREHIPDTLFERAASLIGTATFLGISLGSLAGMALVERITIPAVACIDAASFVLAAALYLSLRGTAGWRPPAARPALGGVIGAALSTLRAHPEVARNFCYVVLTTACFQGFHNIARALLPITHLGMGQRGVMLLQAIASVSFFLGALFVALAMQRRQGAAAIPPWLLCVATALLMLASVLIDTPLWSLASYALYLLLFEISTVFCQKNLMVLCPRDDLGLVSSLGLSLATLAMVLVIYVGGWLSDRYGLVATAFGLFITLMLGVLAVETTSLQLRRPALAASLNRNDLP